MNRLVYLTMRKVGAGLFALSFFMPYSFHNSPVQLVKWALHAAFPVDNPWSTFGFAGAAVIIVYPYFWALGLAITSTLGEEAEQFGKWFHLACHSIGGLLIASIATLLVAVHDTWIPAWIQWTAIAMPAVFLWLMWTAALKFTLARQTAAVIVLGMLPQIPLQFLVAREVALHQNSPLGYIAGGVGATVVVVAALWKLCRP
jgi:hypothetical protein